MLTSRSAALAAVVSALAGGPAPAATCNLTVQGAPVLDDASCTVTSGRATTSVVVDNGGRILIRRSIMSARLADYPVPAGRRRGAYASFGSVIASDDADDRTCYFNQKAVLCVER